MRIRILHVVDTLETGGLENGVVKLIQCMDPQRFEHAVCAIRRVGPLADLLPPGRVKVMCLDKTAPGFSFLAGSLARTLREIKPDIVHSRNWGTMEAVLAGRYVRSCALVHSEHGVEAVHSEPDSLSRRWFRRFVYGLADQVLSVSYQLRDLHAVATGFPADRIAVIHNGVDLRRFCPQPEARESARERFRIPADVFCLGALGRLEPVKDVITLLRAASAMPDVGVNWRLLIAGDGSELPTLREFVSTQPKLRNCVEFLGEIRDVPEFLNALDVYVLPSISEGISNSLLEAMSSGLPAVASATGGNPEVVMDGESGLLFPVGDFGALAGHLAKLCQNPADRSRLGEQARHRVQQHFSLQAMVREYEELYSRLAAGRQSAHRAAKTPLVSGDTVWH